MVIGEVEEAPDAFATGLADDHPVVVAFDKAAESGKPHRIPTTTPDLVEKGLRKAAKKRELGVRVKQEEGGVTFRVTAKRDYSSRKKENG
jgi:hypothetical protein